MARRYEETLEQIVLGEELGFHTAWTAELHFSTDFSPMPAPLMLAVAAAPEDAAFTPENRREPDNASPTLFRWLSRALPPISSQAAGWSSA